ncbi:hypothetical protein HFP67_01335 [Bacillus sp. CB102A.1]
MSKLKSWRSLSFLLWIVITITMVVTMPNMDKLVKEKGKITILIQNKAALLTR